MNIFFKQILAVAVAGFFAVAAFSVSTTTTVAMPLSAGNAAISEAAPSLVTEVGHKRWRKAAVAGLALGLFGIAAHHAFYPHYYYGYPYAYSYYPHDCIRHRGRLYCR